MLKQIPPLFFIVVFDTPFGHQHNIIFEILEAAANKDIELLKSIIESVEEQKLFSSSKFKVNGRKGREK